MFANTYCPPGANTLHWQFRQPQANTFQSFLPDLKNFTYYDGDTGKTVFVNDAILDGKQDVVTDQEELDIIRLNGDGGLDPVETERQKTWADFAKAYKARQDVKRKKKLREKRKRDKVNKFNYKAFGIKI